MRLDSAMERTILNMARQRAAQAIDSSMAELQERLSRFNLSDMSDEAMRKIAATYARLCDADNARKSYQDRVSRYLGVAAALPEPARATLSPSDSSKTPPSSEAACKQANQEALELLISALDELEEDL